MLYLIASPIGNLSDITLRALEALKASDYILCEDTRRSSILLSHHEISKPKVSYHKFNEKQREEQIIADLKEGKVISFLSDAGSPGIADPGQKLVELAKKEGLPFNILPGACALVAALGATGWEIDSFQWCGFLPKTENLLKQKLIEALEYPGISIFYETPHRISETLELLSRLAPQRKLGISREITKIYEEHLEGSAKELLDHFNKYPPKGEFVLLIQPSSSNTSTLSLQERIKKLQDDFNLSLKEAIQIGSKIFPESKREIYKEMQIHKQNLSAEEL